MEFNDDEFFDREEEYDYGEDQNDDYKYADDEQEFMPDYAAWEQVQQDSLFTGLESKFFQKLSIFINGINSTSVRKKIKDNEIKEMITRAENTENIENYNPMGWILGYLSSDGGRQNNISKVLTNVFPYSQTIEEVSVSDIVRYARFWLKDNNKHYDIEINNTWLNKIEDESDGDGDGDLVDLDDDDWDDIENEIEDALNG